jgi:hypothetical protein
MSVMGFTVSTQKGYTMKQKLINLALNTFVFVSLALALGYLFAVALTTVN